MELASGSIHVDPTIARTELNRAWSTSATRPGGTAAEVTSKITKILEGKSITYRYILITGILAKLVNSKIHPRALQKHSKLPGAFDARSLCHGIVVPFEASKGDLWGSSNEPFVNKPARHPEHDKDNPQLRDKEGAILTHEILEWSKTAQEDDLREALILIMRLGRKHLAEIPRTVGGTEQNLVLVRDFVREFLKVSDGGTRLVSVVAAFVRLSNPRADVKVYAPNVSDKFGKTAGDVELYLNNKLISAFECKDRPFGANDITHGLNKAAKRAVPEYIFISGSNVQTSEEDLSKAGEQAGIDTWCISINDVIDSWCLILNPRRRAMFGRVVVQNLITMRRSEVAKIAQELWERISKRPAPNNL